MKFNGKVHEIGREIVANSLLEIINGGRILDLGAKIKKGLPLDSYLHELENCIDDPYVYETFSYFVDEPSWLSLWNTFEMIKFDVDKILNHAFSPNKCAMTRKGWAEKNELEDFTETANNFLAEARPRHSQAYSLNEELKRKTPNLFNEQKHEERKKKYEADHPPMSLAEAEALITRIFRGWCKWKAPTC